MVIVAAIDRSERGTGVIEEAARLSEAFDEPIHAVHVLSASEFIELEQSSVESTDEPIDIDEMREIGGEIAADPADKVGVDVEGVGLIGQPAPQITEYVDEVDARYVILSPKKRSPTGKVLFGSVAQSVLLNVDCPVVTTIDRESV
jgi:nucleotide-binding universal stress UspA family protein